MSDSSIINLLNQWKRRDVDNINIIRERHHVSKKTLVDEACFTEIYLRICHIDMK